MPVGRPDISLPRPPPPPVPSLQESGMPPQSLLLLLLVSLPDCLADNSTSADSDDCTNCIFPFLHHFPEPDGPIHRLHTTCTTIDGDSKPWCATEVDSDNKWTKREYCTASCPGVLPPRMTDVHPGNTVGNCCKALFLVVLICNFFSQRVGWPIQRLWILTFWVERMQALGSSRGRYARLFISCLL